jgi:LPXTG-site transpeptidase (sortase) family protein
MNPLRLLLLTGIILLLTLYTAEFKLDHWQQISQIRLIVPRAKVNTPVIRFYLGADTWDIPVWETRVGQFEGTAWLDAPGNIVLGGHVEYPDGSAGVFYHLDKLQPGDNLQLVIGSSIQHYQVREKHLVSADDLTVLYPTSTPQLTLITCDETSFDSDTQTYSERLVIIADLEEQF